MMNDWRGSLKAANKEAVRHGYRIRITEDEKGGFDCRIWKDGKCVAVFARNFVKDEFSGIVNDALAHIIQILVPGDEKLKDMFRNVSKVYFPDNGRKSVRQIQQEFTGKYGYDLAAMAAAYGCSIERMAEALVCGGFILDENPEEESGKDVTGRKYRVTLYYHTNVTVEVCADNEKDAVNVARAEVSDDKYAESILEGLQEDGSPDVEETQ